MSTIAAWHPLPRSYCANRLCTWCELARCRLRQNFLVNYASTLELLHHATNAFKWLHSSNCSDFRAQFYMSLRPPPPKICHMDVLLIKLLGSYVQGNGGTFGMASEAITTRNTHAHLCLASLHSSGHQSQPES